MELIGLLLLMMLAFYFFMIRPNQKRQKERQNALDALGDGDRVMLASGMFGTIRHLGDKQVVVELAPSVLVTVVREAILKSVSGDEEEFDYYDSSAEDSDDESGGAAEASDEADDATDEAADTEADAEQDSVLVAGDGEQTEWDPGYGAPTPDDRRNS